MGHSAEGSQYKAAAPGGQQITSLSVFKAIQQNFFWQCLSSLFPELRELGPYRTCPASGVATAPRVLPALELASGVALAPPRPPGAYATGLAAWCPTEGVAMRFASWLGSRGR